MPALHLVTRDRHKPAERSRSAAAAAGEGGHDGGKQADLVYLYKDGNYHFLPPVGGSVVFASLLLNSWERSAGWDNTAEGKIFYLITLT